MILKELELKNYKQHAKRKITFEGNLIGVIGPNGSGKSNLLGSIHYALGGEQPGFKKEDLLHWGTTDGFVKLTLQQHGNTCVIRRGVGTASATMKVGESEEFTSITKVNAAITTHLGLDKDLLRQAIFARQAEIDAVLFTDPRDRELAFQRLCGIGDATKVHKELGKLLVEIDAIPDYSEDITEAKLRYKELHARLKLLEVSMEQAQAARDQVPSTADLQAQLQAYAAILPVVERIRTVQESIVAADKQSNDAATALALLPGGDIDLSQMDTEMTSLRTALATRVEQDRLQLAWEAAGQALVALGDAPATTEAPYTPEALEQLSEAYLTAQTAAQTAQAEIKLYRGFSEGAMKLDVGSECPVCGGAVKDPDHAIRLAEDAETRLYGINCGGPHSALQAAKSAVAQHAQVAAQQSAQYQAQYNQLLATYTACDEKLKLQPMAVADALTVSADLAVIEAKYAAAIADVAEVARLRSEMKSAGVQLTKLNVEMSDLQSRVALLPDVIQAMADSSLATAYVQGKQEGYALSLTQAQELDQQLAQLNGMVTELKSASEQLDKTISELEFKQAQQGELRKAVTVLSQVRDWFHYNNGPKTLSNSILQDMTASVNDFLGQLGAPFTVVGNEDSLGFSCVFHDGRPMPDDGKMDAHHLSGGQRMQLAIAFRLASYCMFTARLGLLSLDEPAAYLDDANIGYLCALLPKLKEVAKSMDLQILIATHEKAMLTHMDTVIDLYPDDY